MNGFFHPILLCYHLWFVTFPQSVLNLCFLCTMSLVAIHKPEANKIPVILKQRVLPFLYQGRGGEEEVGAGDPPPPFRSTER